MDFLDDIEDYNAAMDNAYNFVTKRITLDDIFEEADLTVYPEGFPTANNPQSLNLTQPSVKTHFGGLDLRKTFYKNVTDVSDDTDNDANIILTVANDLAVGDKITFDGDRSQHSGTYEIAERNDTTVTVANADTTQDTGDYQKLTTNQWEMLAVDKGGHGTISELRFLHNGIVSSTDTQMYYDTGLAQGNLLRSDNATASDSNLYIKGISEASVLFTASSTSNQAEDFFLKATSYKYKISYVYDGYQKGPLSQNYFEYYDSSNTKAHVDVQVQIKNYSLRLSAVCIYRKDTADSFYRLVKEIPTKSGWNFDSDKNIYSYTYRDTGKTFATYESESKLNETVSNIRLKYGLSTEVGGYLFAADCSHKDIKNASNQLFRSQPNRYSVFDWTKDYLPLKSKPTAMCNYLNQLYVFDESNIYRVNPFSLIIEDTFEGIGCLDKDSLIVTEFGMFFADKNGAYMHTGQSPNKISSPIEKGGGTDTTWASKTNITDVSWTGLVSSKNNLRLRITFDSSTLSILYLIESNEYISSSDKMILKNYIWSYNISKG